MPAQPTTRRIGIVMNGVTGRMGTNQHLFRSIVPIREHGGIQLRDGTALVPEPILVGRDTGKLKSLAARAGGCAWTTDLDAALARPDADVYFDAQTTERRADGVRQAIAAGKHVYCEKPSAASLADALDLAARARGAGVKNGVVQDKLWLPGIVKLRELRDAGFFGRILSIRGEFGYWVFEGDTTPAQRPSWNYKLEEGGGIVRDMFAHWQYILDESRGRCVVGRLPGRHAHSQALGRGRAALRGDGRRCGVCDLRAGGGCGRAVQLVVVRARAARRPADAPGRRHRRVRGGRSEALLDAARGGHSPAGLEPG